MEKYEYINSVKRTLKFESDSIKDVSRHLDSSIVELCRSLINRKGNLIE